jgi:hypothetical protein
MLTWHILVEVQPKANKRINGALPACDGHNQIEHFTGTANIIHQPKHPDENQEGERLLLKHHLRPDPLATLPVRRDRSGLRARLRRRHHPDRAQPVKQAAGHLHAPLGPGLLRWRAAEPRCRRKDQEPRVGRHQEGRGRGRARAP